MLHSCYNEVKRVLQVYYEGVTSVLQGCYKVVEWVFLGHFKACVTGVLVMWWSYELAG